MWQCGTGSRPSWRASLGIPDEHPLTRGGGVPSAIHSMYLKERFAAYDLSPEELKKREQAVFTEAGVDSVDDIIRSGDPGVEPGTIVQARVIDVAGDNVVVDFGGKAEGTIPIEEFGELGDISLGDEIEVFYDGEDDRTDTASVSKRRADRTRAWDRIIQIYDVGDTVEGAVQRKIRGGILVDVDGVHCFLPASQISLRRISDVTEYIGQDIEARIIKMDSEHQNIVLSRRVLLEEKLSFKKDEILAAVEEGSVVKGLVKNITDFGAFVDLGGIDGLLHITDISWGRVSHPSQVLRIEQELEMKVLRVDKERERIALGLKQMTPSPWEELEERYPTGSKHKGEVVSLMSYGAFVRLEEGVEGLVHISEMSWSRRVNHPSELVAVNDEVEVLVLEVNLEKQEISLGMKQAEENPWETVAERYPVGTVIEGPVRNTTSYGAFVEIEEGIDGLLHVSDMSWTRKVSHPAEFVKKGEEVRCVILTVDPTKQRIALGIKQLGPDPWQDRIRATYHVGDYVTGTVTKMASFGVFVAIEDDLEGLLHISELADHHVESPHEIVAPGMKVEVRVLRVDSDERKIALSLVHSDFPENEGILEAALAQAEQKADAEPAEGADEEE